MDYKNCEFDCEKEYLRLELASNAFGTNEDSVRVYERGSEGEKEEYIILP